jgi:uncharacterized membrane protein YccC
MYPRVKNRSFSANGLAISGVIPAQVEELLDQPPRRSEIDALLADAFARAEAAFNAEDAAASRNVRYREALRGLLAGLETIRALAEKAAAFAEDALRQGKRHNAAVGMARVLDELGKVNRAITESEVKDVAGFLFPSIGELEAAIEGGPGPETERHLELSAKFYRALAETAAYHLKLFS